MRRSRVRRRSAPLFAATMLALLVLVPAAAPASAAGECYWGSLQDKTDTDSVGGSAWTTRVKWNYGYNCAGQIISIKVSYARWFVSFYNGGDYDPYMKHTVVITELHPWPYDDAHGPAWASTTDYSCTGGCSMGRTFISGGTPVTWGLSKYTGSGAGFYDSMFTAVCIACLAWGGTTSTYVEFNFPRDNLYASVSLQGCSAWNGSFC